MRTEERTSNHLLLALITTGFSGMLVLVTLVMAWEIWVLGRMAFAHRPGRFAPVL